ncbi:MAG: hypothetical protein C0501_06775 [Isosphaera sp.]|nr:hypothetical protein [Isosphaera sp.]
MRRLAAVLLLAGSTTPAGAADWGAEWRPYPTTPQVPPPVADASGAVVPAAGRLYPRDRPGPAGVMPAGAAVPTAVAPAVPCAPCAAPAGHAPKRSCLDRLAGWLCFRPTTGDALPRLNPHPYVGPVTGTFACSSAGGPAGCADAAGCGSGVFARMGLTDRGCKGKCVPPADDAFPGYRFAATGAAPPPAPALLPVYSARPAAVEAGAVRPAGR